MTLIFAGGINERNTSRGVPGYYFFAIPAVFRGSSFFLRGFVALCENLFVDEWTEQISAS